MNFRFVVDVQAVRLTGKFLSREDIGQMIQDAIEQANPSTLDGDEGQEYEITDWSVEEQDVPKPKRQRRPKAQEKNLPVVSLGEVLTPCGKCGGHFYHPAGQADPICAACAKKEEARP